MKKQGRLDIHELPSSLLPITASQSKSLTLKTESLLCPLKHFTFHTAFGFICLPNYKGDVCFVLSCIAIVTDHFYLLHLSVPFFYY